MPTKAKYKNKEWLREQYREQKKTQKAIADIVDCHQATISTWLNKLGVEVRHTKEKIIKKCDYCGKQYKKVPSLANRYDHEFCSRECKANWVSENFSGKDSPRYKERVEKECQYCGNKFEVKPSLSEQIYCSYECMGLAGREDMLGESNPNWRGGKESQYAKKRTETESSWYINRKRALQRDNNTCQFCSNTEDLVVHHIKPIMCGGTNYFGNLITICRSCHVGVEHPRANM